jgi:hypothetical protein
MAPQAVDDFVDETVELADAVAGSEEATMELGAQSSEITRPCR